MAYEKLGALEVDTFVQSLKSEVISNSMPHKLKLKKFAVLTMLMAATVIASFSSHDASASDRNANANRALTIAGSLGVIRQMNGGNWGSAAGAAIGYNVGRGGGNTAAIILGSMIGAAVGDNIHDSKVAAQKSEKERNNFSHQNNQSNSSSYIIGGNNRNSQNTQNSFVYAGNPYAPGVATLYPVEIAGGKMLLVTSDKSPAVFMFTNDLVELNKMKIPQASLSLDSNKNVSRALDLSYSNFVKSYGQLSESTISYSKQILNLQEKEKDFKYVASIEEENSRERSSKLAEIQRDKEQLAREQKSYSTNFIQNRAMFFKNADQAVIDGYDVSKYSSAMNYILDPNSKKVTYIGTNKESNNNPKAYIKNNPY